MGTEEGRVVVIVQPHVTRSELPGRYFAEITALGLWAYGATRQEALNKLLVMFSGAVRRRRGTGRLVPWLESSKLTWFWADKYDHHLPVINADEQQPARGRSLREQPVAAAA